MRFHQVSLGACLSGAVEDHWLLFWYGVPRAGKNTLGELVEALMGDYARTIPTSTLMSKKFESHPTEMANLQGIRLATSSELSDGDHWNEALVKKLTGDATLSARWIGGNFFEFERTFKLLVYGNYRPQLRSADEALRARLKIVPFNVSFLGREDKGLAGRLQAEMSYVLQWLIDGHQQWLEAGKKLPECAAVDAEISHYFEGQSTPKMWLRECCEILTKEDRQNLQLPTVTQCYRNYKSWKEARGESPLSQTRWQPEALSGLETVKTNRGLCIKRIFLLPLGGGFPTSPTAAEVFGASVH
jgi:putative DNA primase/helicase